jgi:hypothetical protein
MPLTINEIKIVARHAATYPKGHANYWGAKLGKLQIQ